MKTRVKEFFRRNQTVLFLLPATIVLMQLAWIMLNALDPRIGVEGFGDLFGYLLNGARAVLIVFSAWWIKRWCWFDLHAKTELELFERVRDQADEVAFKLIVKDRIEWAVALAFSTWWFTR